MQKNYAKSVPVIRPITYSMYDGRKGIYLALYDSEGKLYDRIASGVHDTVDEYKKHLILYTILFVN